MGSKQYQKKIEFDRCVLTIDRVCEEQRSFEKNKTKKDEAVNHSRRYRSCKGPSN